jgi:hypothetical protein
MPACRILNRALPGHAAFFKAFTTTPAKAVNGRLFLAAFDTIFIRRFVAMFDL